jgi:hypothetical protein
MRFDCSNVSFWEIELTRNCTFHQVLVFSFTKAVFFNMFGTEFGHLRRFPLVSLLDSTVWLWFGWFCLVSCLANHDCFSSSKWLLDLEKYHKIITF